MKIFLCKIQGDGYLNILFSFIKVALPYLVRTGHRTDGIQHRGLPRVVFSHQNQGIFDTMNLHLTDGFKIPDVN